MSLTPGTRLGPYEVIAQIGVGGMGEVYKATDTNLKRAVAIKVLPASVAADAERLARFQREAEVLAALNHPNIAAIYGLERSGATTALVMELVEGPTLADRIAQGAIPLDDALPIAKQIAEALEAAHEQGIIHRDLKPANIKVRSDGTVKVLDFGLAKAMEPAAGSSPSMSMSPTITTPAMTQVGMILGTAAYMAPEQARGKAVDKRADIWAFGCVVFEMLTGTRAFGGEDVTDTIAAVVRAEPAWSALPANTPPAIRRLLRRTLAKDPKERLQAIGDARLELGELISGAAEPAATMAASASPHLPLWRRALPWVTALVLLAGIGVLSFILFGAIPPDAPVIRSSVLPPEEGTGFALDANIGGSAISPDGRMLAFVADLNGAPMLYVRPLDSLSARVLPGTQDAARPFWSPDSRNIGFIARGKLQRIGVTEGTPRVICDVAFARGATWNSEGVIVFSSARPGVLNRVAAAGGTPVPITALDQAGDEAFHYWPQFLPDGKHFIYVARNRSSDRSVVYAGSLDDTPGVSTRVRLVESPYGAVFAPDPDNPATGYLLFVQGANLMAQAFDSATLTLRGEAEPAGFDIGRTESNGYIDLSASRTGVLAHGNSTQAMQLERLAWFDRSGKMSDPISEPDHYINPRLSPNGRSLIVSVLGVQESSRVTEDLWQIDPARSTRTRVTFSGANNSNPIWSPDAREISYRVRDPGVVREQGVFRKAASGTGEATMLLPPEESTEIAPLDWADDGRFLLYRKRVLAANQSELWAIPLESGASAGKPFLYLKGFGVELAPPVARLSPGMIGQRWIAYTSFESGTQQVYVQDFPEARGKWQISTDEARWPAWSRSGKELFFVSAGKLMSVALTSTQGIFEAGKPQPLFDITSQLLNNGYDVSPDGQRFVFVVPQVLDAQNRRINAITLVQNWHRGLGR